MRKLLLLLFIGFYGISGGQNIDPYQLNGTWGLVDSCSTPSEYLVLNYKGYYTRYLVNCQGSPLHISSGECTYYPKSQSLGFINRYTYFNGKWTELLTGDTLGKDSIVELTENRLVTYSTAGSKEYSKVKKVPDNLAVLYRPERKAPERVDSLTIINRTIAKNDLWVYRKNKDNAKAICTFKDIEVVLRDTYDEKGKASTRIKAVNLGSNNYRLWMERKQSTTTIYGNDGINCTITKDFGITALDSLKYQPVSLLDIDYILYRSKTAKVINTTSRILLEAGRILFLFAAVTSYNDDGSFNNRQFYQGLAISGGMVLTGAIGMIHTQPKKYYILR